MGWRLAKRLGLSLIPLPKPLAANALDGFPFFPFILGFPSSPNITFTETGPPGRLQVGARDILLLVSCLTEPSRPRVPVTPESLPASRLLTSSVSQVPDLYNQLLYNL